MTSYFYTPPSPMPATLKIEGEHYYGLICNKCTVKCYFVDFVRTCDKYIVVYGIEIQ